MVRLADLPDPLAGAIRDLPLPTFDTNPWTSPPPLSGARVAIVTTAGLHRADDDRFAVGSADYRVLPRSAPPGDVLMSHASVNFDRTGFQQDLNVVYPLGLLEGLAARGHIGSVADWHYSFMGATDPSRMEANAPEVARLLRQDGVDLVILTPV